MDGTVHPVTELLIDHPAGRCVQAPLTLTWDELAGKTPVEPPQDEHPGKHFAKLSASQQAKVLGPARYQLWKSGHLDLRDLAQVKRSSLWGDHYVPKSLKSLVAEGKLTPELVKAANASVRTGITETRPLRPRPSWIKAVESRQSALIADRAADGGLTVAQYKRRATKRVQEILAEGEPCIQIWRRDFGSVLADGRFRNQFETRTSGGAKAPEARRRLESSAMGVAHRVPGPERPVYGFWGAKDSDECAMVGQYGDVTVRLKPQVIDRTTVTFGDSGDATRWGSIPNLMPMPPRSADYRACGHHIDLAATELPSLRGLLSGEGGWDMPYVEAQYNGAVTIQDIREVVFHKTEGYNALNEELRKRGIKCRMS